MLHRFQTRQILSHPLRRPRRLRDVDLTMHPRRRRRDSSASRSGKSTLLQSSAPSIARPPAMSPSAISIPFALTEDALAKFRNRHVGFVFQDHHLLPQCSVLENVLIPPLAAGNVDRAALLTRAKSLLDRVGLVANDSTIAPPNSAAANGSASPSPVP